MDTLHEDLCTFMIISRSVLLRMSDFSCRSCIISQITIIMFNNFSPENRAFYDIMWRNMVETDRAHMQI